MKSYPLEKIYQEVAFIAYHFHWNHNDIMNMEHQERRKWCEEITSINVKLNKSMKEIYEI